MKTSTAIWLVLAVLAIALTLWLAVERNFEDVHVYYSASRALFFEGRIDLYAADFADSAIMDYRYPPFFLFLFSPLSLLPYNLVQFIWLWLSIFAFSQLVLTAERSLEFVRSDRSAAWLAVSLSLIASAKFFLILTTHFNAHLIVVAFVSAAFYLLLRGKQIPAAVLMALAITIKIGPLLLLPYFAIRKQWRFLAATAALVIVFNLLPALYFGWNANLDLLRNWYDHVVANDQFHEVNGPLDLSLRGQLKRYLVEIDYGERFDDPDYENVNVLSLTESRFKEVWQISVAIVFAGTLLIIWYLKRKRRRIFLEEDRFGPLAMYEFGLAILLMLLVAPRTNGYYLIALFLPLIPLANAMLRKKSFFDIAIFGLVVTTTCLLPLIPGRDIQRLLLVLGVDFWPMVLIWVGLIGGLFRESSITEADDVKAPLVGVG